MPDDPELPKPELPRPPGVAKPPPEADIAEVSKDQALIADEWGTHRRPSGLPRRSRPAKPRQGRPW